MASIEKRSDTTYRITVSCGYDKQGKKLFKKKTVSIEPKLSEKQKEKKLNELAVLFEKEVENGIYLDGERITFGEFAEIWLRDYAEKQLAPGTLNKYRFRLNNRIIPALGHIKLSKLQPHHLAEFYNNLAESGMRMDAYYRPSESLLNILADTVPSSLAKDIGISPKTCIALKNGGNVKSETAMKICNYYKQDIKTLFESKAKHETLSSKTVKHHHDLISTVLGTAMEWNIITTNPASRVKAPKVTKSAPKYYDDEQLLDLFSKLESAPLKYKTAIYLTIDTGLRLSELAGLKWTDIDFQNKSLEILRQRQYVDGYGVFEKNPKTENGVRVITLTDTVIRFLNQYRKEQLENKIMMGSSWLDSPNVFIHEDGIPLHPHRPYRWFVEFIEKNNLPKITFHQLRHTNASLLIAAGIDIVTLSGRLGHADKNVTLNTYSHIIRKKEQQAANQMESFYSKLNPDKNKKAE